MFEDGIAIARKVGVGDGPTQEIAERAVKVVLDNYEALARSLELTIDNIDWTSLLKHGLKSDYNHVAPPMEGKIAVQREFRKALADQVEGFDYECEKDWGVLPREKRKKPESQGEAIGEALFQELYAGPRREGLNALAVEDRRRDEASLCKRAVKQFLFLYQESMKKRVEQLRR